MIGFPTANVEIDSQHKLIPADGAYAVMIRHEDQYWKGMLNIGYRPTVGGKVKTIEVHIFNFEKEIYGDNIFVNFKKMIRKEIRFEDVEALKKQLAQDKIKALALLKND